MGNWKWPYFVLNVEKQVVFLFIYHGMNNCNSYEICVRILFLCGISKYTDLPLLDHHSMRFVRYITVRKQSW